MNACDVYLIPLIGFQDLGEVSVHSLSGWHDFCHCCFRPAVALTTVKQLDAIVTSCVVITCSFARPEGRMSEHPPDTFTSCVWSTGPVTRTHWPAGIWSMHWLVVFLHLFFSVLVLNGPIKTLLMLVTITRVETSEQRERIHESEQQIKSLCESQQISVTFLSLVHLNQSHCCKNTQRKRRIFLLCPDESVSLMLQWTSEEQNQSPACNCLVNRDAGFSLLDHFTLWVSVLYR